MRRGGYIVYNREVEREIEREREREIGGVVIKEKCS